MCVCVCVCVSVYMCEVVCLSDCALVCLSLSLKVSVHILVCDGCQTVLGVFSEAALACSAPSES